MFETEQRDHGVQRDARGAPAGFMVLLRTTRQRADRDCVVRARNRGGLAFASRRRARANSERAGGTPKHEVFENVQRCPWVPRVRCGTRGSPATAGEPTRAPRSTADATTGCTA